ncbi:MAG: 16S rRNA (cytidine(1402)-2'-O)-methyltransferase [Hyphomicrobiaceae bacterium]|nr:16S rRNA (cytidine(1402)-2'-O)-methyltransferase [Hyphomicrobiaceae bacterium]
MSGLYIVATPIGNLSDITLRALYVLTIADKVYCENKHISQKLFARYGIVRVLKNYHEHNAVNVRREILADISNGKRVALICDAGTPTISDPGFKLIATIIKAGYYVTSIPGPSAAITALTISGIPTDRFLFAGFLNSKSSARKKEIQMLAQVPTTLLFYEAPHRLCQMLADLIEYLGDRPAVLVRELTKKYEECKRGLLSDLFEWAYNTPVRGEFTVVVAPPENKEISDGAIIKRLHQVLADISLSKAAKQVAEEFNVSRKRVYSICLDLKHDQD